MSIGVMSWISWQEKTAFQGDRKKIKLKKKKKEKTFQQQPPKHLKGKQKINPLSVAN